MTGPQLADVMGQLTDFELAVLIGLVLVGLLALVLLVRRAQPETGIRAGSSAVPADLAAIEAEVSGVKGRLQDVEHDLKQVRTMLNALPTKDSVHAIALKVSDMQGDLKVNSTTTLATARTVERIEDWLKALELKALGEKAGN